MIKLQEIYRVCKGFEGCDRKAAIKKLMTKGFNESAAIKFYNIWRRDYMKPSSEELSKEQLVKVTQAVLK